VLNTDCERHYAIAITPAIAATLAGHYDIALIYFRYFIDCISFSVITSLTVSLIFHYRQTLADAPAAVVRQALTPCAIYAIDTAFVPHFSSNRHYTAIDTLTLIRQG